MFVPDYKRVIYDKPPLVEVSAHIRFPPILKIETEVPSSFQELNRQSFPLYDQHVEHDVSERLGSILTRDELSKLRSTTHVFETEDNGWTVQLDSHSLTLITDSYTTWGNFKKYLRPALDRFVEVYSPKFYSYLALRYVDVISRLELGFAPNVSWNSLIQPYVLGELGREDVDESAIQVNENELVVKLPDIPGFIGVRHGLQLAEETEERVYSIEHTFFTHERTEINDAEKILDAFNGKAGAFFRWCITETLHEAMAPKEPSEE